MLRILIIITLAAALAVSAFDKHPALAGMGDTSWLKIQDYYSCGMELCYNTLDYSGMTYDFHRHKILMFGGGHATRFWNQVEEFDFENLTWVQLYKPDSCIYYSDPAHAYPAPASEPTWPDGGTIHPGGVVRPISRHTYDGLDMLHDTCLMIMSTTQEGKGGCMDEATWSANEFLHDRYVWVFDPVAIEWTRLSPDAYRYGTGNAVDPRTDLLYGKEGTSNRMLKYNWKTMTISQASNSCPVGWEIVRVLTYYPPDHSFFLFSKNNIHEYDIATDTWTTKNPSGEHQDSYNRQIPYDSVNNVFGMINNGAFHYYSPATNTWYKHPYDTNLYPENPNFEHTIYDRVDNVYVVVVRDGYTGWETWAYKLSDNPGEFPGTGGVTVEEVNLAGRGEPVIQVQPNPFNYVTLLNVECRMSNAEYRSAEFKIYNIKGSLVKDLSFDIRRSAFDIHHSVKWSADGLSEGVYLLKLRINGKLFTKKLFLVR